MPPISVSIKHAGKKHELQLDTSQPPRAFREAIYAVTGVAPDKQKVLIKGGQLKDDADWSKLGIKPGYQFMVIGTAGELPKPPPEPIKFMEDMSDVELAKVITYPAGLTNLGNTCYMNSTIQVLRAIPELQTSLSSYNPAPRSSSFQGSHPNSSFTVSLRELYRSLSSSGENAFPPMAFVEALRQLVPQFGEISRAGGHPHYAQQDAEECWTKVLGVVRDTVPAQGQEEAKFVERYLMGEMTSEVKCTEAPEEAPTVKTEKFLELKCNISITTNFMLSGITDALKQPFEKHSPTLGRDAVYEEVAKISRLPSYLTVHMVRFYWRRDINKKTKIMRRIKFPFSLDLLDLCTAELKAKISPVAEKLREMDKNRQERAKVRKRRRRVAEELEREKKLKAIKAQQTTQEVEKGAGLMETRDNNGEGGSGDAMDIDDDKLEDEKVVRAREREELEKLVNPELKADLGANVSGQYELVGLVTHKGASADGGHYMGWVKKGAVYSPNASTTGTAEWEDPDRQEWYKFDDDRVTIVPQERIKLLEGGGEDSTAYILLYRSVAF